MLMQYSDTANFENVCHLRCPALELERTVGLMLGIWEPEWNTDVD